MAFGATISYILYIGATISTIIAIIRCDYIHSEKEEQRKEKVEVKVKTSLETYISTIKYFLKKWPTYT